MKTRMTTALALVASALVYAPAQAANSEAQSKQQLLQLEDVFQLEYASNPAIHPSGDYTVFVRNFMNIMADRKQGNLWRVNNKGELRPLTGGDAQDHSPTWSPDGKQLAFVSNRSGSNQIHLYWTDTREHAPITRLTSSPSNLSWSPDGKWLAFTMFTPQHKAAPVSLPGKPQGASWAEP